jgi:hypothetical protein
MDFRHLNPFFNENDVIDVDREDYLNKIDNYTINIKKSMKIYEKDITKQKEYMILYDLYMDMQFREFYKNHKNYGSLC